jgi:hypothetical protein
MDSQEVSMEKTHDAAETLAECDKRKCFLGLPKEWGMTQKMTALPVTMWVFGKSQMERFCTRSMEHFRYNVDPDCLQ